MDNDKPSPVLDYQKPTSQAGVRPNSAGYPRLTDTVVGLAIFLNIAGMVITALLAIACVNEAKSFHNENWSRLALVIFVVPAQCVQWVILLPVLWLCSNRLARYWRAKSIRKLRIAAILLPLLTLMVYALGESPYWDDWIAPIVHWFQ